MLLNSGRAGKYPINGKAKAGLQESTCSTWRDVGIQSTGNISLPQENTAFNLCPWRKLLIVWDELKSMSVWNRQYSLSKGEKLRVLGF